MKKTGKQQKVIVSTLVKLMGVVSLDILVVVQVHVSLQILAENVLEFQKIVKIATRLLIVNLELELDLSPLVKVFVSMIAKVMGVVR